jgi:hypothetical protein
VAELFGTTVRNEPSLVAFALQQLFIPLITLVGMLLGTSQFDRPDSTLSMKICADIFYLAGACIAGGLAGAFARRVFLVGESGRWIWVIPTLLVFVELVWDSIHLSIRCAFAYMFLPPPFIVAPVIGCMTYSAVIRFLRN